MFLKRLFGKSAGTPAPVDQVALVAIAFGPGEVAARRDACRRLTDLGALRRLADEDADASVRDQAEARFQRLLCGSEPQGPDLAARLGALERLDAAPASGQRLLAMVAGQSPEPEARAAALGRLTEQAGLADCALHDALAANRLLAAGRLNERAALERVAKGSGKRDKNVYRLVRQRLKALNEAEARPRKARAETEALCERLGRLGRFDHWVQDRAVLDLLDQQWAGIAADTDPDLHARYSSLREGFLTAYQAWADAHAADLAARLATEEARNAAAAGRARIIDALRALPGETRDDLDALDARLGALTQDWAALPPLGASAATSSDFAAALAAARAQRDLLLARRRQTRSTARVLADAQALLAAQGGTPERKAVAALQRRREALAAELAEPAEIAAIDTALAQLTRRCERHREQVAQKCARLGERLAELDTLIEAGELRRAEPLLQSISAVLDQARAAALPTADLASAEAELKRVAPRLKDLRQWRRWSTDEHREALCTTAEALAAATDQPLPAATRQLRELQQGWRELERTGAPASDSQRARFRAAIEQAQAHCQPYLDQLAERVAENRQAREALCVELETFLAQVDWTRIDWKRAARAEREMRQAWAALDTALQDTLDPALPAVGERRQQAPLEGRFRRALRGLDKALADERERNQAHKRDLITGMLALVEEPDLHRAVDAAKALQQQWATTVPGNQREENALWQRFRGASDQVFARRNAEQEAKGAELRENQALREAICQDLTVAAAGDDRAAIAQAISEQRRRWHDTQALALTRNAAAALEQQWHAALTTAEGRVAALAEVARATARGRLAARADYCDKAARGLLADPSGADRDALQAGWEALEAPADSDAAKAMERAMAEVLTATADQSARDGLAATMAANRQQREGLCLHLEITAGIPSPAHLRQQRMQLQVARLRERIGEGAADPLGDAEQLLRDWYLACPAAPGEELETRFKRVCKALSPAPVGRSAEAA